MNGRFLLVLAATALLALGGSAAALADDPPPTSGAGDRGAAADRRAERADVPNAVPSIDPGSATGRSMQSQGSSVPRRISSRRSRGSSEKLASGELTPEQRARAKALLEKLEHRLAKVMKRLERLKGAVAEHCNGDRATPAAASTNDE